LPQVVEEVADALLVEEVADVHLVEEVAGRL
jgi:hypothetical protein